MSDYLYKSDRTPGLTMPDLLLPPGQIEQLALPLPASLARAGQAADTAAAARLFQQYRSRRAAETVRRQDADLACFAAYLAAAGVLSDCDITGDITLASDASAWVGVTWGIVSGFVAWQVQQGYAVGSINVRLATVKAYAKLATQAGALSADEYARVRLVSGYRHAEGRRLDAARGTKRKGRKKAAPVSISRSQASTLKQQADPLARLLLCLLLDHGLRVGEVASLTPADFDLARGVLRFYRSKVDKTQTHRLSDDALAAAEAALAGCQEADTLFGVDRTIRRRVGALGAAVGLAGLSPHDCRHYWATAATRAGTPLKALQDAGGWSSPAMPLRYAESAEIANDGVKLG
jgi:integrase